MNGHEGHPEQSEPRNRFHPRYESFTDWLNAEAPAETFSEPVKKRNPPSIRRYRMVRA